MSRYTCIADKQFAVLIVLTSFQNLLHETWRFDEFVFILGIFFGGLIAGTHVKCSFGIGWCLAKEGPINTATQKIERLPCSSISITSALHQWLYKWFIVFWTLIIDSFPIPSMTHPSMVYLPT